MGMIEIKKDFTKKELLWFGPLMALFVGIIGWILIGQFDAERVAYGLWIAAGALIVLYYLIPPFRAPIFRGWMYSVMPIGWVVSHVLLSAIYYLLLTPIGLLMKLCRYDPMHRKFEASADSYWIARDTNRDKRSYFKQH